VYKPNWRISSAKTLEDLEVMVNKIQEEGYVIEDINTTSLTVVFYKYKELESDSGDRELLVEQQDEGCSDPNQNDWEKDYGQQAL